MTLMLVNESKKEAITLRYGDGLNKMMQLNPEQKAPCPPELRRTLLQHYLATFKDLKLIDDSQPVKVKEQKDGETVKAQDSTSTQIPEEKDQTKDGEKSDDNDSSNEGDSKDGDVNPDQGDQVGDGQDNSEDQDNSGDPANSGDQEGQDGTVDQNNQPTSEGDAAGQDETVAYDEKTLTKLSAEEVKKIAASLGIEVTDESTKKGLIPVILDKQGK